MFELNQTIQDKKREIEHLNKEKEASLYHYDKEILDKKAIINKEKEAIKINFDLEKSEEELKKQRNTGQDP